MGGARIDEKGKEKKGFTGPLRIEGTEKGYKWFYG